jgi:hypothetical protein
MNISILCRPPVRPPVRIDILNRTKTPFLPSVRPFLSLDRTEGGRVRGGQSKADEWKLTESNK